MLRRWKLAMKICKPAPLSFPDPRNIFSFVYFRLAFVRICSPFFEFLERREAIKYHRIAIPEIRY